MEDLGVKIIQITSVSPVFKGIATLITGIIALLFAFYMKKKKSEPDSFGFRVFIALGIFIVVFGLFVLIFQPQWWMPPYEIDYNVSP